MADRMRLDAGSLFGSDQLLGKPVRIADRGVGIPRAQRPRRCDEDGGSRRTCRRGIGGCQFIILSCYWRTSIIKTMGALTDIGTLIERRPGVHGERPCIAG